jgi:mono/diheme cytochrome c family protein
MRRLLFAGLILATPAAAQTNGDAAFGLGIARSWCSNCHVIGDKPAQAADQVPSFPAIAARPTTTAANLHTFLLKPHGQMPNFALTAIQIDDTVAYIMSLRK